MTQPEKIFDILADCPALTNGGKHSLLFKRSNDDNHRLSTGFCQYCGGEGTFTRIEFDAFISDRDARRAAARRRREPKSGRK